jgi:membrane protein DedA with SNARE-associated domain
LQTVVHFLMHANPFTIYLIVALVLLLESSGVPIINETLLIFVGALASFGHINIWALTVAAIVGSVAGACLAYSIGVRGGRQVMLRVAAFFRIDARYVDIAENWFQKSGVWMIFFSRMTPFVRPFACFPAGIARVEFLWFFMAASAGSLLWCAAMLSIGWNLGHRWKLAVSIMEQYTVPTLCVVVVLLVLYCLGKYAIKRYLNGFQSGKDTLGS